MTLDEMIKNVRECEESAANTEALTADESVAAAVMRFEGAAWRICREICERLEQVSSNLIDVENEVRHQGHRR
jgi:hypothetical protein